MKQIKIVLKKEYKEFATRKSRIARFIIIDLFCFVFLFTPTLVGIDVVKYRAMVALVTMIFMNYAILGFMAVDIIGMEKKHSTFETLLSTPLTVTHLLFGKCLFMFLTSFVLFSFVAIGDSIILSTHGTSFFAIGSSRLDFLIILSFLLVFTIFYIAVSAILSILSGNEKMNRYSMFVVVGVMITVLIKLIQMNNTTVLWLALAGILLLTGILLLFIRSSLNKVALMKYFR